MSAVHFGHLVIALFKTVWHLGQGRIFLKKKKPTNGKITMKSPIKIAIQIIIQLPFPFGVYDFLELTQTMNYN